MSRSWVGLLAPTANLAIALRAVSVTSWLAEAILRFLGYLRARQVDLGSIAYAVGFLNAVPILGLLTRSYDRAAVLSGDRIGAYACDSVTERTRGSDSAGLARAPRRWRRATP